LIAEITYQNGKKNISILGLSAGYHDASASVVNKDGEIVFAGHAERYSRKKNDPDLNMELLAEACSYTDEPITEIAWYEKPLLKHTRQIYSGEKSLFSMPFSPRKYLRDYVGNDFDKIPIKTYSHHKSHAAAGFQTSGFDRAICVVIDAIGEWDCFSFWLAECDRFHMGRQEIKYTKLDSVKYPHSLGLYYSAITKACGLKPNEEEYITMGMAAYGNPSNWNKTFSDELVDISIHGHDFHFKSEHNFHIGMPDGIVKNAMASEDIAAAGQYVVERVIRRVFDYAVVLATKYKTANFVYMGGVALNCVANNRIYPSILDIELRSFYNGEKRECDYLWIMPNPGDAGSSLGAAALSLGKKLKWESPFLGTDIPGEYPVANLIKELMSTKIVGIANGRAEFGPRALGNRSLLADPRGIDIKDKVNEIKRRQKFRPFAPVILEEYAEEYFEMAYGSSEYMQYVSKLKPKYYADYPAIQHVDNTARVQTVPKDCKSGIRQLLEQWYFYSGGCPMLLNTSLNIRGEPMVNDRNDADRFEKEYGVRVL